jgi:hypothetical protein
MNETKPGNPDEPFVPKITRDRTAGSVILVGARPPKKPEAPPTEE